MRLAVLLATMLATACSAQPPASSATPASSSPATSSATAVGRAGDATLYLYPEVVAAYPPGDRGAYVVTPADEDDRRAVIALVEASGDDPDDVIGEGFVVRAGAAPARSGRRVEPLQPAGRRGPLGDGAEITVHIDLFAGDRAATAPAVQTWLTGRGARVLAVHAGGLEVKTTPAIATEAARLSAVRWIERR